MPWDPPLSISSDSCVASRRERCEEVVVARDYPTEAVCLVELVMVEGYGEVHLVYQSLA